MERKQAGERHATKGAVRSNRKRLSLDTDYDVRRVYTAADERRLSVVTGYSGRSQEPSDNRTPSRTQKPEPMLEPTVVTTALPGQSGEAKPAGTVTYVGAGFWARTAKPDSGTVRMAA